MRRYFAAVALATTAFVLAGCNASDALVQQFKVGECVNFDQEITSEETEVGELPIVSCDGDHDGEVYFIEELEGGDYPATVIEDAGKICVDAFPGYVGAPYETSSLDFTALYPSPDTWSVGDRDVVCIVIPVEGALNMSVKDSGL